MAKVGIIMGSDSDLEIMKRAKTKNIKIDVEKTLSNRPV